MKLYFLLLASLCKYAAFAMRHAAIGNQQGDQMGQNDSCANSWAPFRNILSSATQIPEHRYAKR